MFFNISILKNLVIFTGKKTVLESLFSLKACNFIKKTLQHRRFPVKIAKFLRTPFFTEHRWLLLCMENIKANDTGCLVNITEILSLEKKRAKAAQL